MRLQLFFILILSATIILAQEPYRVGTTSANFLEIGQGAAATGMGQAYVAVTEDVTSSYWNPAGAAYLVKNEASFSYQRWFADSYTSFAGVGLVIPDMGVFVASVSVLDFGRTEVTTVDRQNGTGETYSAMDLAASVSFSRKIADWFSFGVSGKFIHSSIWHVSASTIAADLGVRFDTDFFSPDGSRKNGLSIGMSIANYGGKMQYDGLDLIQKLDIEPGQAGNYGDVQAKFNTQSYELPLIMRLGIAVHPIITSTTKLTVAVDALHPNNNSEYVNIGGELKNKLFGVGELFLRGGYRGLFMVENQYGLTLGGGVYIYLLNNLKIKLDYAYQDHKYLGNNQMWTIGMNF